MSYYTDMELSVGELADAAGLSRRAVRFYVQQNLLQPPNGRGRGKHYDESHLARLRRVIELQTAGHSLQAIRQILAGATEPRAPNRARRSDRPTLTAELWTRLRLAEGVELQFDAARYQPRVEQLLAVRAAVRAAFAAESEAAHGAPGEDESLCGSGDP